MWQVNYAEDEEEEDDDYLRLSQIALDEKLISNGMYELNMDWKQMDMWKTNLAEVSSGKYNYRRT